MDWNESLQSSGSISVILYPGDILASSGQTPGMLLNIYNIQDKTPQQEFSSPKCQ